MGEVYEKGQTVRIPTLWVATKWPELQQIVDSKKGPVVDEIVENWEDPDQGTRTNPLQQLEGGFHDGVEGELVEKMGQDLETGQDNWLVTMTYYKANGEKITTNLEFTTDYFIKKRGDQ